MAVRHPTIETSYRQPIKRRSTIIMVQLRRQLLRPASPLLLPINSWGMRIIMTAFTSQSGAGCASHTFWLPLSSQKLKSWVLFSNALRFTLSLLVGATLAVTLNYFLYRFGLPVKPFIYQVF